MDKLKAVRGGHRSAVTRLMNKTDEKIAANDISNRELCTAVETLEKKREILQNLDNQIVENTEVGETEQEILDSDDYSFNVDNTIRKYKDLMSNSGVSQPQQTVSDFTMSQPTSILNQNSNQTYGEPTHTVNSSNFFHRLPKLDLPTFSGDILEWQTFWDSFQTTVHTNPSLTNVQKFSYLKSQLNHDAERCIAGLALTSANYDQAICLLKERFGQEQHIINAYMQSLLELPSPSLSPTSLRNFYDKMETSIRGLQSLGQSQDSFGSLLVPIIFGKLPIEMRKNMTREHGISSWDIKSLREAIGKETYVQETGSLKMSGNVTPTASFYAGATPKSNIRNRLNRRNQNMNNNRTTTPKPCIFCHEPHFPSDCTKVATCEKRYDVIKQKRLCYNCFGNHKVSECKSKYTCRKCNKRHHTSLCDMDARKQTENVTEQPRTVVNTVYSEVNTETATFYTTSKTAVEQRTEVLLKTAITPVSAGKQSVFANILLDEGSQKSFINEELARKLNVKPYGVATLNLAAFGDAKRNTRNLDKAVVDLITQSGEKISIDVLIVPTIAAPLTNSVQYEASKLPYLRDITLAHPVTEDEKFDISMLIGADFYWNIVENEIIRGDGPTAVKSKLGYLLSGPMTVAETNSTLISTAMMNILVQHKREEVDLERFWKLESMGVTEDELTKKDPNFYENYESSITYQNQHYVAKLPWKEDFTELPSNYNVTKRRTQGMINRLNREPEMLKIYGKIIADQESRGFIEKVDENKPTSQRVHYIPHHGVKKESSTTPIRIVYDCSCRESNDKPSLNDCLQTLPPKMNELTGILTRFRMNKYAVTTDIEKAFLQVELHENDRDVTRFFWYDNPMDPTSQLTTYRFRVVLFGTTCSPFILYATIMKHLKTNLSMYTETLKSGLYVDNILSSFADEESLLSFYSESRQLFRDGGFNLRSWSSNNPKLRQIATKDESIDEDKIIKILGLRWNNETDTMLFQDNFSFDVGRCLTKREILKQSSRIFDPLGILSPVTVRAKILMQRLWEREFGWDERLPDDIRSAWISIVKDFQQVINMQMPRCYFSYEDSTYKTTLACKLHVFSDASMSAYGACAYIVRGEQSSLVMSKNRVASLKKQITLPKLELMGALLGTRLATHLLENLGEMEVIFWSDSQIVLKWISSTKPLKKFIDNRVREIRSSVNMQQWKYCPTDMNPADLLTRSTTAEKVTNNTLWTNGPDWITKEHKWPIWNGNTNTMIASISEDGELENTTFTVSIRETEIGIHQIINLSRYNSLRKLLRITAYVFRFISNCKNGRGNRVTTTLSVDEIQHATIMWIRNTQETTYPEIVNSELKRPSLVKQLNIYKDETQILRCRGRIDNALVSDTTKYPYLKPTKHKFTTLVVMDAHESNLHGGVNSTVTYLRQTYWIPRISQCVNSVIRKCVSCRRVIGKPYLIPSPPPLPVERVQHITPFSVSGVDFSGPLYVKNHDKAKIKVYLCLFTCAATRAIHIEIVSNLTESSFILAFRRFPSRKSLPKTMMSDNALTFIAASKEIQNLTNSSSLHEKLSACGTTWKFIPKRAPWFGGYWERMIGLTKSCLKKVLGNNCIDLETLQTIIPEIEASLNDRPLTYISSDSTDPEPLTPSHLLYGRRITRLPYPKCDTEEHLERLTTRNLNARLLGQTELLEHFNKRWKNEYLTLLREYHRTVGKNNQVIKVGDIVQIHNDTPRSTWKLAVVDELLYGDDKLVRAAKLRTNGGFTNRPIAKLYPIEVNDDNIPIKDNNNLERRSKEDAKVKIRQWTM